MPLPPAYACPVKHCGHARSRCPPLTLPGEGRASRRHYGPCTLEKNLSVAACVRIRSLRVLRVAQLGGSARQRSDDRPGRVRAAVKVCCCFLFGRSVYESSAPQALVRSVSRVTRRVHRGCPAPRNAESEQGFVSAARASQGASPATACPVKQCARGRHARPATHPGSASAALARGRHAPARGHVIRLQSGCTEDEAQGDFVCAGRAGTEREHQAPGTKAASAPPAGHGGAVCGDRSVKGSGAFAGKAE